MVSGTGLAGSGGFSAGAAAAGLASAVVVAGTACASVVLFSAAGFRQPDTAQLMMTSAAAPERKLNMVFHYAVKVYGRKVCR